MHVLLERNYLEKNKTYFACGNCFIFYSSGKEMALLQTSKDCNLIMTSSHGKDRNCEVSAFLTNLESLEIGATFLGFFHIYQRETVSGQTNLPNLPQMFPSFKTKSPEETSWSQQTEMVGNSSNHEHLEYQRFLQHCKVWTLPSEKCTYMFTKCFIKFQVIDLFMNSRLITYLLDHYSSSSQLIFSYYQRLFSACC